MRNHRKIYDLEPGTPGCEKCGKHCWNIEYEMAPQPPPWDARYSGSIVQDTVLSGSSSGPLPEAAEKECLHDQYLAHCKSGRLRNLHKRPIRSNVPLCKKCKRYCWAYEFELEPEEAVEEEDETSREAELRRETPKTSSSTTTTRGDTTKNSPYTQYVYLKYLLLAKTGKIKKFWVADTAGAPPCQLCDEHCWLM